MTEERKTCPRCGKARKPEKHGSITQWITTCSCLAPEEAELQYVEVVPVCQTCGKRVSAGRSGSFTQWVFRSDICSCEKAALFDFTTYGGSIDSEGGHGSLTKNIRGATVDSIRQQGIEYDPEADSTPEIEVDADAFPADRYKPIAHLDRGASGVVYLARDRLLGTKVAVKCLRALSAEQLIAFQNEARATSKLNHECIVKVLNFGATECGAPYMVMEYIDGITLKCFVENYGPLPLPLALDIFIQICDALSYAHGKGIYHRDLKSSNIMLVKHVADGHDFKSSNSSPTAMDAYLIDFGVAMVKHATQEPTIIQGNTVVGTPSYMPPDQSVGKPYDRRSEIYALGCVMFEALTGDVPFNGQTAMEVISMHASQPPPLLCEINGVPSYPEGLQAIVSRCLEKDQDKRFQSTEDLASILSELGEVINAAPVRRRATGEVERSLTNEEQDKKKRQLGKKNFLLVVVGCLLPVSIAVVAFSQIWEQDLKPTSTKQRLTKQQKKEKAFAAKFSLIYEPRVTTLESTTSIDDSDLRLITDIKPRQGTELAVNLKDSARLTGRNFKFLPAKIGALDCSGTGITDDGLKNLGTRPELRQLCLVRTGISKEGLKHLSLPGLLGLDLSHCHKIDDDAIKLIVNNWPDLEFLAAAETGITGKSIKYITRLTRVKSLVLDGTPVTNNDLEKLSKMPLLDDLAIANTEITDEGLEYLVKMPRLRVLGLVGSLNIKEPEISEFMKRRPDVTVRGRRKQEVEELYFSTE